MVFYGPSGTGKTTVANIIAARTNRTLRRINATTGSLSDIKEVIADVGTMLAPNGILLYLDEIQYFNKKQQQSLLEVIERGDVTLIASTTENPYFYVYNAVLSRSTVFEFKPIEADDVLPAVDRGMALMGERLGAEVSCEDGVREYIASCCGGDVRKAMNAVELLLSAASAGKENSLSQWRIPKWQPSAPPCDMTGRETTTTTSSLPSRSPSAVPTRTPPATTWPVCWRRET